MLTDKQLSSIGFRWATNDLELLTPYGVELARRPYWYAPHELSSLHSDQANVKLFIRLLKESPGDITALSRLLMPLKDIRRTLRNCGEIALSEVELFEIKRFLMQLALIAPISNPLTAACKEGSGLFISPMPQALHVIDPDGAKSPTFYVSESFSDKLASIRAMRKSLDLKIRSESDPAALELYILERTSLSADEERETASIRYRISLELAPYKTELLANISALGNIDYALARARLAVKHNGIMPRVESRASFEMRGMVNPMVEETLAQDGRSFTPVSIAPVVGSTVITGANMGGKSIALKTLALNCALAMCGFPVFAESATMPPFGGIYMLCEDGEDAKRGLSSFGGEMFGFNQILSDTLSIANSLVLLDEFARGTNPHEGGALVKAAVICFNRRVNVGNGSTYAVIATHFDGAACLAGAHYQVAGLKSADLNALFAKVQSECRTSDNPMNVAKALEGFMDYGLYPVSPYEEPPRDAVSICRALNVSNEFLELVEL